MLDKPTHCNCDNMNKTVDPAINGGSVTTGANVSKLQGLCALFPSNNPTTLDYALCVRHNQMD